jgi:hypothetical protein
MPWTPMPLVTTKSSKNKGQWETMSVKELKKACMMANVSGKGPKEELCLRLRTPGRYQKASLTWMPIGGKAYQRWDFTEFDKFAKAHGMM